MNSHTLNNTIIKTSAYYQFYIFNKVYFFYLNLLKPLLNIELYDKIGVSDILIPNTYIILINHNKLNFSLYLDKYSAFQSIKRYMNNQSKDITFNKLSIIFNEYNNILEQIIYLNNNCLYLYQIKNKYKNFNNQLIESLEILRKTYNNYDVNNYVAAFITILLKL
jgi:hypothetical protein